MDSSIGSSFNTNRNTLRRAHEEGLLEEIQQSLDMYLETKRQIFIPSILFLV